ncbi:MAG: hypothetical protein LRY46_01315 [Candidatus Pacebacteria bacterium]|nr:hypothetical protein [Candidatus Paceibacterota bacterium]
MKNLAINLFRKKKIEYHFVECMQTHERMCTHPTHQKDHLDYLEKIDSYNQAATVLECLSERDKNIILLRADEYSYQEIMSLLGLKESVVKTRLNRVRTKIKEKLSG